MATVVVFTIKLPTPPKRARATPLETAVSQEIKPLTNSLPIEVALPKGPSPEDLRKVAEKMRKEVETAARQKAEQEEKQKKEAEAKKKKEKEAAEKAAEDKRLAEEAAKLVAYTNATKIIVGKPRPPREATTNWGCIFYYEPGSKKLSRVEVAVKSQYGTGEFEVAVKSQYGTGEFEGDPKGTIRLWLQGTTLWMDTSDMGARKGQWFKDKDQVDLTQLFFGSDPNLCDFINQHKPRYQISPSNGYNGGASFRLEDVQSVFRNEINVRQVALCKADNDNDIRWANEHIEEAENEMKSIESKSGLSQEEEKEYNNLKKEKEQLEKSNSSANEPKERLGKVKKRLEELEQKKDNKKNPNWQEQDRKKKEQIEKKKSLEKERKNLDKRIKELEKREKNLKNLEFEISGVSFNEA